MKYIVAQVAYDMIIRGIGAKLYTAYYVAVQVNFITVYNKTQKITTMHGQQYTMLQLQQTFRKQSLGGDLDIKSQIKLF